MVNVLVVNSIDALSGGVHNLLSNEMDFQTTNKNITDKSSFEQALDEVQPDAVVINESLFYAFPDTLLRWNLLFPKTRVIVLDERQNLIHLFENKEIIIERSLDLVTAIRGK